MVIAWLAIALLHSSAPPVQDTVAVRTLAVAPALDGVVGDGEYGRLTLTIPTPAGPVRIWLARHDAHLYIAAHLPDSTYYWGDDLVVSLDPDGSGGSAPGAGDRQWYIRRLADSSTVSVGSAPGGWTADPEAAGVLRDRRGGEDWAVATASLERAWSVELRIDAGVLERAGGSSRISFRTFNDSPQGWWAQPAPPANLPAHRVERMPDLWLWLKLD